MRIPYTEDWEQKRLQREKETEDIVRRKFEMAEQEKQKRMKEFDKMAKEASKERERIHAKSEELLQDKIRQADLDKKRHLEVFDKLARHDDVKKTVQKTPGELKNVIDYFKLLRHLIGCFPLMEWCGWILWSLISHIHTTSSLEAAFAYMYMYI